MPQGTEYLERCRFVSPDGMLTFVVEREGGDITTGFDGTPWHTHGDILASEYDLPQEKAVARFIEALLQNKAVIAIASIDGIVRDVWVTDDPLRPDCYQPDNEVIAFRFWDGTG